jgi:hypothetical protein
MLVGFRVIFGARSQAIALSPGGPCPRCETVEPSGATIRARIRKRAELEVDGLVWHSLRHTYAVHLAKSGLPLKELQVRLGHASLEITARYAAYAPPMSSPYTQIALDRMGLGGAKFQHSSQQSDRKVRKINA